MGNEWKKTSPAPEAVIFDLDGTLFRSETLLEPVYRRIFVTLREEGLYLKPEPPLERFYSSLGMLVDDIWRRVLPDGTPEARKRANDLLMQYGEEDLKAGKGDLFEGVPETLRELRRRGIRLFVASNGMEAYVREVVVNKGIGDLFEGLYSAGQYGTASKADLVRLLMDRHGVRDAWMVGDRASDVEAGRRNGLMVVGCAYAGFGREEELAGSDAVIRRFPELLDLLQEEPA